MIEINLAFIIQAINFLLLLFILNVFLYKPIRKILADREAGLSDSRDRVQSVDKEVAGKMAEYEARLKEVKAKGASEREAMKREATGEESKLLEAARADAGEALSSIKQKVAREAAEAKIKLQEQARSLSLDICEKLLGRSL